MEFSERLVEEERKKRQSEWSKVRDKSKDFLALQSSSGTGGANIDHRPLHEKLTEQRMLEEQEARERSKMGNYVRKLDFDEVEFLSSIKEKERVRKIAIKKEESVQLKDFKKEMEKASSSSTLAVTNSNSQASKKIVTTKSKARLVVDNQRKILSGLSTRHKKKEVSISNALVSYDNSDEEENE